MVKIDTIRVILATFIFVTNANSQNFKKEEYDKTCFIQQLIQVIKFSVKNSEKLTSCLKSKEKTVPSKFLIFIYFNEVSSYLKSTARMNSSVSNSQH